LIYFSKSGADSFCQLGRGQTTEGQSPDIKTNNGLTELHSVSRMKIGVRPEVSPPDKSI